MCLGALGVVERTWSEGGIAMASVQGKPVCLMYTPTAAKGDAVLVHMGYAMEILDGDRAAEAAALRRLMAGSDTNKESQL